MIVLAGVLLLVAVRNPGVWSYLLRRPGAFDGTAAAWILSRGLWPALMAASVWALGLGLGRRVLLGLRARPAGFLDGVAAAALGTGLIAQAVFLLGWAGAYNPWAFALPLAGAAGLALTARTRPRAPSFPSPAPAAAALLGFCAFHLLVVSLAPPAQWDVRAYHLALPELYLSRGRLDAVPWMLHSHWPHLMEALYGVPLALGRDGAAALLHAGACALLAAGVLLGGGGWAGAVLLAGQPAFLRVAPSAHSDGACALLLFAAALALSRWEEEKKDGWLAAAGLLAGLSAAAKLFGGAGAASWTVWLAWRTRRPREAALFAACAAAILAPWLLRVWSTTGDPLWPLLRLDPASAALAARNAATNIWAWPPPSWLLAHDGPLFLIGPLAGLKLLSGGAKGAGRLERLLWIPAPLLAALAFRHHEAWRYMMPAYAAAACAGGRLAGAAFAAGGLRRPAAALLVAAGAAPILGLTQNNELFTVLGLASESSPGPDRRAPFEERAVDVASFYREARAALPPGARVLLFREVRGYRAGFDYLWGDPVNQDLIEYRRLADFDALRARLRELGVTHVLDHPGSHLYGGDSSYYDARTLSLMSGMLARGARPVLERDGLVLHRLL